MEPEEIKFYIWALINLVLLVSAIILIIKKKALFATIAGIVFTGSFILFALWMIKTAMSGIN